MMRALSKMVRSLWIMGLLAMLSLALPVGAFGMAGMGYDFPAHVKPANLYDGVRSAALDYNSASVRKVKGHIKKSEQKSEEKSEG